MGMNARKPIGVLLMAYGSPECVEDLPAYLLDVRGGRPMAPGLLAEIRDRYELIGGRSPLLDLTRAQAEALQRELNRRFSGQGISFKTYVGMRHWQPRISAAVEQMSKDGIKEFVGMVMAPHSSRMSTGAYFARLEQAVQEQGLELNYTRIESWHDDPGFIQALADNTRVAMSKFQSEPFVMFTAHSLPARILETGDPYDSQLRETARLLAQSLDLPANRWSFCYQSAGQSEEIWLGPSIEQAIMDLAGSGVTNLLVVPMGFVCDHVEILYDIDIAARQFAGQHGVRLERSDSLNVSPGFIDALADITSQHLPIRVED